MTGTTGSGADASRGRRCRDVTPCTEPLSRRTGRTGRTGRAGRSARAASAALAVALAALALAGCGGTSSTDGSAEPGAAATPTVPAPGLTAPLVASDGLVGPAPLVVLVPGGSWRSADPTGLAPLADALAADGATAALVSYRTSSEGAYFPVPVQDVACGVAQAAAEATAAGHPPTEVVLVGHSAGAQLAAVVALDPDGATSSDCPYPQVAADRLVGLAGPYDVAMAADVAVDLFGPDRPDPSTWDDGNPLGLADRRPDVPVLLVHGSDDTTVPTEFTTAFAEALTAGGHDVTTRLLDGVDHQSVYSAAVAAPVIADWLGLDALATPVATP